MLFFLFRWFFWDSMKSGKKSDMFKHYFPFPLKQELWKLKWQKLVIPGKLQVPGTWKVLGQISVMRIECWSWKFWEWGLHSYLEEIKAKYSMCFALCDQLDNGTRGGGDTSREGDGCFLEIARAPPLTLSSLLRTSPSSAASHLKRWLQGRKFVCAEQWAVVGLAGFLYQPPYKVRDGGLS